jgi:hypothetical protein
MQRGRADERAMLNGRLTVPLAHPPQLGNILGDLLDVFDLSWK